MGKKQKYWYRFYWGSCPVCGRDYSYKERVYGEKPRSMAERYTFLTDLETYDNCVG